MTWTTLPNAGQKPPASTLSALITELRPLMAVRTNDQTLSNNTTLQNDNQLSLAYAGPAVYDIEAVIIYQAGTTADFKTGFTFSNVSAMTLVIMGLDSALAYQVLTSVGYSSGSTLGVFGGAGIGSQRWGLVKGNMTTTGAGTLQFQWAQNSAVVENTLISSGSQLRLLRTG
jgi:hypothetical protein